MATLVTSLKENKGTIAARMGDFAGSALLALGARKLGVSTNLSNLSVAGVAAAFTAAHHISTKYGATAAWEAVDSTKLAQRFDVVNSDYSAKWMTAVQGAANMFAAVAGTSFVYNLIVKGVNSVQSKLTLSGANVWTSLLNHTAQGYAGKAAVGVANAVNALGMVVVAAKIVPSAWKWTCEKIFVGNAPAWFTDLDKAHVMEALIDPAVAVGGMTKARTAHEVGTPKPYACEVTLPKAVDGDAVVALVALPLRDTKTHNAVVKNNNSEAVEGGAHVVTIAPKGDQALTAAEVTQVKELARVAYRSAYGVRLQNAQFNVVEKAPEGLARYTVDLEEKDPAPKQTGLFGLGYFGL